jgi:hypothetical protein
MSKNEKLVVNREVWESMRNLDKKAEIRDRYYQILELYDEELEIDLL